MSLVLVCLYTAFRSSNFAVKMLKFTFPGYLHMSDDNDLPIDKTHPFDPLIQNENIAFAPEAMVACDSCRRLNPPNRDTCIYCSRELEVDLANTAAIGPKHRKLEIWERGFNVIFREILPEADVQKAAQFLSLDNSDLASLIISGQPLPLARVENEKEASFLQTGTERYGLKCSIMKDVDLGVDKMPVRLGRIDFLDDCFAFEDFNTRKVTEIDFEDLVLIIPGFISSSRVDSLEKKRRNKEAKLLEETATMSDESILDIYSRKDDTGFRIYLAGFDFSCLGEDKGLLAVENLRRLIGEIKDRAPNAKLVNDYAAVRYLLGLVWEIESRKDSKGLVQTGFGKREFGAVSSTNNLNQFTKFSRLQWHLL